MIEWVAVGVVIFIIIVIWKLRKRGESYTMPSGPVYISGSGESVVERVKKFKDRCLGALR